jgi:hypothetical protein
VIRVLGVLVGLLVLAGVLLRAFGGWRALGRLRWAVLFVGAFAALTYIAGSR